MTLSKEIEQPSHRNQEQVQAELDRRVFYMKTLYDVSMDIFSSVETDRISRLFLMMTMGNFGLMEGFVLLMDPNTIVPLHSVFLGFEEVSTEPLTRYCYEVIENMGTEKLPSTMAISVPPELSGQGLSFLIPFRLESDYFGAVGLGQKLTGEEYSQDDLELLVTLANNLVVALKNARSFEKIKSLNEVLRVKNLELSAALRKVEILESVKSCLSKFVPTTVCKIIEESSTDSLTTRDRDVSVLFLDVEGYTRISEKLQRAELNELIERYFSVFMDAIYENHGDVNETAGDGLMVIFHDEDRKVNALQAVRAARSIKEKAAAIRKGTPVSVPPLVINMGISSGPALVGTVKFESYTGVRWTYTARGMTTNIAARIGALATGGRIFVSKTTADRVNSHFRLNTQGKHALKNVSEELEIFELLGAL